MTIDKRDYAIDKVAKEVCHIDDLSKPNRESIPVWMLKYALEAAYNAGKKDSQPKSWDDVCLRGWPGQKFPFEIVDTRYGGYVEDTKNGPRIRRSG